MRSTVQEQIASLMGNGMLGNNGMLQNVGMADQDEVDTEPSGSEVVDGRANTRSTCLQSCSARSCANNVKGEHCSLTQIEITETGGCGSYEAAADDYDQRDAADEQAIIGISAIMPEMPEHPSSGQNMLGQYDPGH